MTQIKTADLEALVELCVCDGHEFGVITKMVRDEWPECGVRDAITLTAQALRTISTVHASIAVGATARAVLARWTAAHPGVGLGLALPAARTDPA